MEEFTDISKMSVACLDRYDFLLEQLGRLRLCNSKKLLGACMDLPLISASCLSLQWLVLQDHSNDTGSTSGQCLKNDLVDS